MDSRLARIALGGLATLLWIGAVAGSSHAAPLKGIQSCSAAIIKASATLVQKEAGILQKCANLLANGKKPCDPVKTQVSIDKARAKLSGTIAKKCGGRDKICDTADANGTQPTLTEIGWNLGTCPNFEAKTCTNALTDCDDIATCLQCIGEASVSQVIELYYPTGRAVSTDKKLKTCRSTIGKASRTYLTTRSKALAKCWGKKVKKTANCPADADAKGALTKARGKLTKAINKACAGFTNAAIGLEENCPAVTSEGAAACGATVASAADVAACVGCVTDFKVECPDRAGSVSVGATYPTDCPIAFPTATPTPTVTPVVTPTLTPTPFITPTPNCGDDVIVPPGEFCDGTATGGACKPSACDGACTCACPAKVHFAGDATDDASILDTGWTGIAHRAPIITNGDVTVALDCGPSVRPCGVCTITGPVANENAGSGQLDNRRCSHDSAIKCSDDTPCTAGGGTCVFYFGSNLPLAAGGVSTCVTNIFSQPVTGTANVETGDATTTAKLSSKVYLGIIIDSPCPRCIGDTTLNDGAAGGTCSGGTRDGLGCDGNGQVFNRPDFGTTSLDCPAVPGALLASLPIDLSNSTGAVTKTVTANSPTCGSDPTQRCMCDTCNNVNAEPCDDNTDCPDPVGPISGICGGRRCVGGTNPGAPCNGARQCVGGSNDGAGCPAAGGASVCPGGACTPFCTVTCSGGTNAGNACAVDSECPGIADGCPTLTCGRRGEPSAPSACLDDPGTPGVLDCEDSAPIDGEGECSIGPIGGTCSIASGHAQRTCGSDAECTPGTCLSNTRRCFLTGGFSGDRIGDNVLTAVGMADVPVEDVAHPTLGAVFCIGPVAQDAVNSAAGLPGPGRVTIRGTAKGILP